MQYLRLELIVAISDSIARSGILATPVSVSEGQVELLVTG